MTSTSTQRTYPQALSTRLCALPIARFPIPDQLGIISATMPEEADATNVSDTVQGACADAINDGSSQAKLVLTNTNAGHIRFAQPGHPPETISREEVINKYLEPNLQA